MKVRQLIGRYAGAIIEMPYAEATACLAAGTVALPDDADDAPKQAPGLEAPKTPTVVGIPEDWRALSWQEKRKLAAAVSDSPIHNLEDAESAIEAHLEGSDAEAGDGADQGSSDAR